MPASLTELPPAVLKRWIGFALRRQRTSSAPLGRKLVQEDIAELLGCGREKVAHLESGRNMLNKLEVQALFSLYKCPQLVDSFLELVKLAKKRRPVSPVVNGDPTRYTSYAGLEEGATGVETASLLVPHGLSQTAGTAEAIMRTGEEEYTEDEIQERLEQRLERQSVLHRKSNPLKLWMVIPQAVLEDLPGPPEVQREQLQHFVELAKLPHVDIQVLAKGTGVHRASHGPFTIMTFPIPGDSGLVYVETLIKGLFFEEADEIMRYKRIMDHLRARAKSQEQSTRLMKQLWKELQ